MRDIHPSPSEYTERYAPQESIGLAAILAVLFLLGLRYLGENDWVKVVLTPVLCYLSWRIVFTAIPKDLASRWPIKTLFGAQAIAMVLLPLATFYLPFSKVVLGLTWSVFAVGPSYYLYSILPEERISMV